MASHQPLALSRATRLPPIHLRAHSRSPSRSPVRKSAFAAREIDPLLSNLSPDSTLKALQATSTITTDGSSQDAIARSIADATSTEREIGIRAAVAAQKYREWKTEVEQWSWPDRRGRGHGAGFLPPNQTFDMASTKIDTSYLGYLPRLAVSEYQDRIEDIRDGMEALELEDIKQHVFSSHVLAETASPVSPGSSPSAPSKQQYGKMRDFTALITATVVQALPDMARLTALLDIWDIRLSILRQIPSLIASITSTRAGIEAAKAVIIEPESSLQVTLQDFETTKSMLGSRIRNLGRQIDDLLDILEGQEDTLPKEWIDAIETMEDAYAAWVVDAERLALSNAERMENERMPPTSVQDTSAVNIPNIIIPTAQDTVHNELVLDLTKSPSSNDPSLSTPLGELPSSEAFAFLRQPPEHQTFARKPALPIKSGPAAHRRGVSEISAADSALSALSDLSQAEIIDAKKTEVLASPKVSLIDNPLRTSRDGLSLFTVNKTNEGTGISPDELNPLSDGSIRAISRRKSSEPVQTASPSNALNRLYAADPYQTYSENSIPADGNSRRHSTPILLEVHRAAPEQSALPPAMIDAQERPQTQGTDQSRAAEILYQSSQLPITTESSADIPASDRTGSDEKPELVDPSDQRPPLSPRKRPPTASRNDTLEDKIKDILCNIPAKIRLAEQDEQTESKSLAAKTPSRSTTPLPALTLTPAKPDRSSRKAAPGDVRLFHLNREGQSRDAPSVKLFVRAVGEHGERVMVRVGGGWADLAEYLQEYSLHHGHRGLGSGKLEVTDFPVENMSSLSSPTPNAKPTTSSNRRKFSFGAWSQLAVGRSRRSSVSQSLEHQQNEMSLAAPLTAAPSSIADVNKMELAPGSQLMFDETVNTSTSDLSHSTPVRQSRSSTPAHFAITTDPREHRSASPISSPVSYTPLGGAGPKSNSRRVVSIPSNMIPPVNNPYLSGTTGKGRSVSSNATSTIVQSPTITTTTTVTSKSSPRSPLPTTTALTTDANTEHDKAIVGNPTTLPTPRRSENPSTSPSRPKSRMNLGDVGGIRRVFLRRKSGK